MNNENIFQYNYSARNNQEVLSIRSRYLPREETKLEELKRLDRLVQASGVAEGLGVGIIGCMLFGLGLCLAMKVIGDLFWLGILLGLVGMVVMGLAYPVHRRFFAKAKERYVPRILQLTAELTGEN